MSSAKRLFLLLTILVSCVGCDQATKSIAKAHLSETHAVSLLGDTVRLQIFKNYGAFLSLGESLSLQWRTILLTGVVAVVLGCLLIYLIFSRLVGVVFLVATALFAAGGLSNLYDRIAYGGYVVDFLNLGFGTLRTGIFNIADMFIMLRAALFFVGEPLVTRRHSQALRPGS